VSCFIVRRIWWWWWCSCRCGETTSVNYGHQLAYCSSPKWYNEYGDAWWNGIGMGKLLIRLPDLSGNHTSSHLVAEQDELAEEVLNLALRSIFVHTSKGRLTCCKILRLGADSFTSLRRKACCEFLSPSAGFEAANLGSSYKHANHQTTDDDPCVWLRVSLEKAKRTASCLVPRTRCKPGICRLQRLNSNHSSVTLGLVLHLSLSWLWYRIGSWCYRPWVLIVLITLGELLGIIITDHCHSLWN
jgi:hypothetical protein